MKLAQIVFIVNTFNPVDFDKKSDSHNRISSNTKYLKSTVPVEGFFALHGL